MPDPYYQRHIFFCLNDRDKGEKSCAHDGAARRLRPLQVAGEEGRSRRPGQVRVNKAGCLEPLRRRAGRRRLSRRRLVHLRRPQRHRRDRRLAPEARRGGRRGCCCRPTSAASGCSSMTPRTVREQIAGPAGAIECAIDRPAAAPRGLAVVCHPHPQFGGTLDNKVVQTIARACLELGWAQRALQLPRRRRLGRRLGRRPRRGRRCARGRRALARPRGIRGCRTCSAGFSFGGYVAVEAAQPPAPAMQPRRIVLVGPSTEKQRCRAVPADTLVIHGESDDVVPLAATLAWARPQASAGDRLSRRRPLLPRPARAC